MTHPSLDPIRYGSAEIALYQTILNHAPNSWDKATAMMDYDCLQNPNNVYSYLLQPWTYGSLFHGQKHGTCSFPVIQDEYCYFSTALNLYFKYNMTKILTDAGYVPNNTNKYPLGDIVATIKDAFGASPLLVCKHGAVEELHICFYKDFKPRDCIIGSSTQDDMLSSRSSCPRYISLPEYSPLMLQDGNAAIPWLTDIEAL